MSPASQGNLEVERYIGSCLISSSVRVTSIGSKNNSTGSHSNVNYRGKKVSDCGGSRVSKLQAGAFSHRTAGGTCRAQLTTGRYSPHGSLLPLCECGGLKFGGAGYGSPGPSTGVGGSWAGLPLISMAPSNSRRNRKPSTCSNGSVNNRTGNSKSASGSQATAVVASPNSGKNSLVNGDNTSQHSRTPLSRLAIHTQGAPLILAGRYTVSGRKSTAIHNRGPPLRQFRCGDLSVRRGNSARDTRDNTGGSGSSTNGNNSNTPSSDCLSVTSDESSGHSENSLPRIIKPRKRRKKDRKPPPLTATSDTSSPSSSKELKNPDVESPSIVTLKPYVPLCYELYDSGCWIGNRPNLAKVDTNGSIKVWEAENRNTFTLCNGIDTQEDDEHVSQTSEDDNQEPKLHHNFDEVEDDDDGGLCVDSGGLFPYPCPPTLCHCRYCDPSGLIWDVDQHCYSPFLTPPPPTVDGNSTSFPFSNSPLFLTPPPTEVRSFDFFNKDPRSTPSPLMFHPENDHFSVLRRSWSEPLPPSFCNENTTSSNEETRRSFGIIGHGRVREVENVPEPRQVTRLEGHTTPAEVPPSPVALMTSQSLEVSTEIVTSPNGHRDIEIKFYSSSPPADTAVVSTRDTKSSCDVGVRDGNGLGSPRTFLSSSVEEVCSEGAVNVKENTQQENGESSVNAQAGTCKQDAAQCDCGDNVWVGDGKEGCNVFDHGFCEQSAKSLGEEVDQLHLHAEE